MNKQRIYWICQVFGWSLYGLLQISLFSVAGDVDDRFVIGELFQVVVFILLTHFFRYIILSFNWLNFKWYSLMPRIIAGNLVLAMFHFIALVAISYLLGTFNPAKDLGSLSIIANVLQSMTVFFFWSLIYLSFHYFERYNRTLQNEAALKEIELTNLKAQLNPHFIFNALNSIRALVDENPGKSKRAITQLSNILRNSLNTDRKKLVSFTEELDMVKDYLSLESIRYEERLKTSYKIDPASNQFQIPPLMLQTLVENGIKHGVSSLKKGGLIEISTEESDQGLKIQIRNSGKFLGNGTPGLGYGLLNTRKRLELIFGDRSSFFIGNEGNDLVLTEILIPKML
jgi:two-component system LytT family sensor kinase